MRAIKESGIRGLFSIVLLWICFQGVPQIVDSNQKVDKSIEHYRILTDRSIYIAGEVINFRVFNLNPDYLLDLSWSKVFYLELISPVGYSHARAKYSLNLSGTENSMKIPTDIPSGTYFLKGYSRWMRNFGPTSYSYLSIEIVNPYNKVVLTADTSSNYSLALLKRDFHLSENGPDLRGISSNYKKRAMVHLNLSVKEDEPPLQCCITVIHKGYLKSQWESVHASYGGKLNTFEQIPETKGISVTGKVELAGSGFPAPYAVVYISLMGKNRDFYCNYADSLGRFYFAFPNSYGDEELFISASSPNSAELDINIDKDFCTESIALPSYPLKLDETDLQVISDLSMNAQIREQYFSDQPVVTDEISTMRMFFYGNPSAIIKFDDFIKLPTMEEYFSEVIPEVSLQKSNRTRKLRVLGEEHQELEFYEPLMMIDGVGIFDVESILEMSPRYVEGIEIVDAPYVKGYVTFGGIIHIISRNNDMGFIDLPASGLLVNYKMFEENLQDDQIHQPADSRLPDVRNTLYWNPWVELNSGENMEISFKTPDKAGDYQVLIRGYSSLGKYFEKSIPFMVE